jgi:hypothetical protein
MTTNTPERLMTATIIQPDGSIHTTEAPADFSGCFDLAKSHLDGAHVAYHPGSNYRVAYDEDGGPKGLQVNVMATHRLNTDESLDGCPRPSALGYPLVGTVIFFSDEPVGD